MENGKLIGFLLWLTISLIIIGIGIAAFFAKKAVGFWANVKPLPMKDIKAYNRAVGKLFIGYGLVAALLGLPILADQSSAGILLSVLGIMLESIGAMIVYTLAIQNKYEKK